MTKLEGGGYTPPPPTLNKMAMGGTQNRVKPMQDGYKPAIMFLNQD